MTRQASSSSAVWNTRTEKRTSSIATCRNRFAWVLQRTGRFHTHANRFRQVAIELVRFSVLVFQTALDELACLVIQHRDLLIARVKITSYNLHCSAPLFRALVASATKFTREKEPTTSSNQPARTIRGRADTTRWCLGCWKSREAQPSC